MKRILALIIFFCLTIPAFCQVNIILDNDGGDDLENAYAMALAMYGQKIGACNVKAIIVTSVAAFDGPFYTSFLRYSGVSAPVGVWQGGGISGTTGLYTGVVTVQYGLTVNKLASQYLSSTVVYRQALAAAAPKSIKIVVAGPMSSLSALMQSPADGISPMTGAQLVASKVVELDVQGGWFGVTYPSAAQFNWAQDPTAAAYVYNNWPTSVNIYSSGTDVGGSFTTGGGIASMANNAGGIPLLKAALTAHGSGTAGAWDETAVMYAIFGGNGFFGTSASGTVTVNGSTGAMSWSNSPANNQYYLTKSVSDTLIRTYINSYLINDTYSGPFAPLKLQRHDSNFCTTGGASCTVAAFVVGQGDTVAVCPEVAGNNAATFAFTLSTGDTLTPGTAQAWHTSTGGTLQCFTKVNATGSTGLTVAVTASGAGVSFLNVWGASYSGALLSGAIDASVDGHGAQGTGTALLSGSFSTSSPNELVVAFVTQATGSATYTAGNCGALIATLDPNQATQGYALESEAYSAQQSLITCAISSSVSGDWGIVTVGIEGYPIQKGVMLNGVPDQVALQSLASVYQPPIQTAAIASTELCSARTCPAGEYRISVYLDSTLVCATPGSAAAGLTLTWVDNNGAHVSQTIPLSVNGGATLATTMALGNTTNYAQGTATIVTSGINPILYATSYTACSSGTGTYGLSISTERLTQQ